MVLYGDTPFVQPETLERMVAARGDHAIVVLGFNDDTSEKYGRLVMEGDTLTVQSPNTKTPMTPPARLIS